MKKFYIEDDKLISKIILNFCSESDWLLDTETASIAQYRVSVSIMAHEIIHQWIGDLVGSSWWSYLWITEGFAELLGFQFASLLMPETKGIDYFVLNEYFTALDNDATVTAHHLDAAVYNSKDAESVFDTTSYSKGM